MFAKLTCFPDTKQRLTTATDLRDNIDVLCNGPSYAAFLKKLVPVLFGLLKDPPVFISTSWEQVWGSLPVLPPVL